MDQIMGHVVGLIVGGIFGVLCLVYIELGQIKLLLERIAKAGEATEYLVQQKR
jgi:hypothetical protein